MATDLDRQIREVELRLIGREDSIRRQLAEAWRAGRRALSPSRLKLPVLALVGVTAALGWWRLSRRHPDRMVGSNTPVGSVWIRLLGLPVAEWLIRRRSKPLLTMDAVDPQRFAGDWFVAASLAPRFWSRAPLTGPLQWNPQPDGGIDIVLRSSSGTGPSGPNAEHHTARGVPGTAGVELEWSDWPKLLQGLPWAWESQAVVHVDPHYREALIGNLARTRLWLMYRDRFPARDRLMALVQIAQDRGFPIDRLVYDEAARRRSPARL